MFLVPVSDSTLVAWHHVAVDRRAKVVEIRYASFQNEAHLLNAARPPIREIALITIAGPTAVPLLVTNENHLYDDSRALVGRLLTGTATEQEKADVSGWEALGAAILVPGVTHVDSDPFELEA